MPARKMRPAALPPAVDTGTPRFRSGAVARMLRMPVATLRIWERRYGVSAPATTPAGHRLYSALDVQRLALLRQLTEHGHAIGAIARLDIGSLREVAATHAGTLANARQAPQPRRPIQVVVVGAGLARRLRQPALRRMAGPLRIVAERESPTAAGKAPPAARADLLLVRSASLHEEMVGAVQAATRAWSAKSAAVLYGFGTQKALDAFADAGIALLREPQDDRGLASWLERLCTTPGAAPAGSADDEATRDALAMPLGPMAMSLGDPPPRRYDDATLADFAGLSSTIACECPRHVAELLVQLSHFEAYSAECRSRGPKDAELHAYLARVAGSARALFEAALERVAIEEGLVLRA